MGMRRQWIGVVSASLVGDGTGAAIDVEVEIDLPAIEGNVLGYRLRHPTGSGSPNWTLNEKTGLPESDTAFNLFADAALAVTADGPDLITAVPFVNRDTAQVKKLYWVIDNNAGASVDTWTLDLLIEYWDGGRYL